MRRKKTDRKLRKEFVEFDVQIRELIAKIRSISFSLENRDIRLQLEAICTLSMKILRLLREKPKSLNDVQTMLQKYLHSLYNLSEKYGNLLSLPTKATDVKSLLRKSEDAFKEVHSFLEGIHAKLLSDEILDLDIQLSVLETELEMDKLHDESL